jgi:WD40 repeat protein
VAGRDRLSTWRSATQTAVISIAWSPDGRTIASGELGGTIYLWDTATGQAREALSDYTPARSDANGSLSQDLGFSFRFSL